MEKPQPQGVLLVDMITVLSALGILWIAYLLLLAGHSNFPELTDEWLLWIFGVLLLVDAALVFRGMRTGYYLSMASWILLFSAALFEEYTDRLFSRSPLLLYPILYSIICLFYFSRNSVKTYFGT